MKVLRKQKKMSQAELASAVGVKQSTVAMWESGKNKPRLSTLPRIANVLEVSIAELIQTLYKEAS